MKIIMYGTPICKECVRDKAILAEHKEIEVDYRIITESTSILKDYLAYRDKEPIFDEMKANHGIGIPFYILEDGTKTLYLSDFVDVGNSKTQKNSCSINGRGSC